MTYSKNPAAREPAISSPRAKRGFVILRVLAGVRLYPLWHYYCLSSEHDHEGSEDREYRNARTSRHPGSNSSDNANEVACHIRSDARAAF
jgi:hypothetical protein